MPWTKYVTIAVIRHLNNFYQKPVCGFCFIWLQVRWNIWYELVYYICYCIFWFYDFHLFFIVTSVSLMGFLIFFICFERICSCLLKHSYELCFTVIIRRFWHDSSCCQFIIFSHSSCDFLILVWQVIFNCIFGHFSYYVRRILVLYKSSILVILFMFDMQGLVYSNGLWFQ